MKNSQRLRVIKKLQRDGYITRNECLGVYPAITRLSAIIQKLEEQGFEFEPKDLGNDWKYIMIKSPYVKTEYINPITKEIITTYQ